MSQSEPTALVTTRDAIGTPQLLRHFLLPLIRGQAVTMGVPLNKAHLEDALASVVTGEASIHDLQFELQTMAARLVAHPLMIDLTVDDMKLAAAAYQVCWFFHWAPERDRIWRRRLENIAAETEALVGSVGLPRSEAQVVARHLMFRHLPRLFRQDTKVEFGAFWGSLQFMGTEPSWVKLPGRSRGALSREKVWVYREIASRPVSRAWRHIMSLSPLTNLLACDRMGADFSYWGAVAALALPSTCRIVTNDYLKRGLGPVAPTLARGFMAYAPDASQPLTHRLYVARFLYNLVASWCQVQPVEALDAPLEAGQGQEVSLFYEVAHALHGLRGPLGGAHLMSDEVLLGRVERFLRAPGLDRRRLGEVGEAVAVGLGLGV